MFAKLGSERTSRDDRRLAAYLAFIAGAVNAVGFSVIGTFTSHVTGDVGRFADQLALGNGANAAFAGAAVVAFFFGAIAASMLIESRVLLVTMSRTSAALLVIEAALISAFVIGTRPHLDLSLRAREEYAMLLACAMGMQNSLVTRLSGAVVRTTHLTGVVTDLGIETARWFRDLRFRAGAARGVRLTVSSVAPSEPIAAKAALLATIFFAFVIGSTYGALLSTHYASRTLLPIVALLVGGAIYALVSGRSVVRVPKE